MKTKENALGIKDERGKKPNQKLKPYLVLQILMRKTDENHIMSATEIVADLGNLGIEAERRSIYSDIAEINKALYALEQGCTIDEAAEDLENPDFKEEKFIVYKELNRKTKGFCVSRRKYDLLDLRLLAECAYSTRFLTESQSRHLINDVICEYVSDYQRESIIHDAFLTDRTKTENKAILRNLETINYAMRYGTATAPHKPEKIKVVYVKSTMKKEGIRSREKTIVLTPYALMINEGYYYLLAYQGKKIGTWRIDRMKEVTLTGIPRDCDERFSSFNLAEYSRCNFGMTVNTKRVRVSLICADKILDTVLDRLGTNGVYYGWVDEKHFRCDAVVEMSHQFYGWVCGLGEDIKIATAEIAERYAQFLSRVQAMY